MTRAEHSDGSGHELDRDRTRSEASIRRDGSTAANSGQWPPRVYRRLAVVFLILMVVFSAIPLAIDLSGTPNKDYSLWYQVGVVLRQGMDIYPDPATGRLFPFMYPPSAARSWAFSAFWASTERRSFWFWATRRPGSARSCSRSGWQRAARESSSGNIPCSTWLPRSASSP